MDVIRAVDTRLQQVQMILDSGFADPSLRVSTTVLVIPEADTVLLLLRQLPQSVALHIQLHGTAGTYANVCDTVRCYDLNTRLLDVSKIHSFQGPPFGKDGKGKGNGKKGMDSGDPTEKGQGSKGKQQPGGKDGKGKKSTKGKGNFLKGWSRRIPVPCLSSAEAELFTLVEGLKESIGLSLLVGSIIHGLTPKKNDLGFFEGTEGKFKIVLRTDSQAALQIEKMQGLLRRVRHLELRVAVLQFYTDSGRLEILFIPGAVNSSDALTKPGDAVHQGILLKECGFSWMQDRCQTRIRSRIVHCLGKLVRQLLDAGVDENRLQLLLDENRQHLPFRVPVPQRVLFHKGFCPLRVMTWKRLDGLLSTGLVRTQTILEAG